MKLKTVNFIYIKTKCFQNTFRVYVCVQALFLVTWCLQRLSIDIVKTTIVIFLKLATFITKHTDYCILKLRL